MIHDFRNKDTMLNFIEKKRAQGRREKRREETRGEERRRDQRKEMR